MYTYTDQDYEPEVRDYGDSYHDPELAQSDGGSFMENVRTIKRKYTNYFDWLDAVQVYNEYTEQLIEKYGGSFQALQLAWLTKQFEDYIPVKPQLRKTRRNRILLRDRVTERPSKEEAPVIITYPDDYTGPINPTVCAFNGKDSKFYAQIANSISDELPAEAIGQELDQLTQWYKMSQQRMKNLARTKRGRRLQQKMTRIKRMKMNSNYVGLTELVNEHREDRRNTFFGIEEDDKSTMWYKGTILRTRDVAEIDTIEKLKTLGVNLGKASRVTAKIIRKKRKKSKKIKKAAKYERKFMRKATGGRCDDFGLFEKEMINLTGINPDMEY